MAAEEILIKLCELARKDGGASLEQILKEAFNEYDELKLLKKRNLLCEHCKYVLKGIGAADDTLTDVLQIISTLNAKREMILFRDTLNLTQEKLIKSIFSHYKDKNKFQNEVNIDEIVDIVVEFESEIQDADINEEQKETLKQLCLIVKEAKEESKIIGSNRAIDKLHTLFIGKFFLYGKTILNIKDPRILEKIKWIYAKIGAANSIIKTLKDFKDNLTDILTLTC